MDPRPACALLTVSFILLLVFSGMVGSPGGGLVAAVLAAICALPAVLVGTRGVKIVGAFRYREHVKQPEASASPPPAHAISRLPVLLPALLLLLVPSPSRAGSCYVVYDEAYRQTLSRASGMDYPSRNGDFSSMAECEQALAGILSDPQYRYDAGLHRSRCECVGGGSGGGGNFHGPSGGSFEQQVAGAVVSAFLNALLTGINAPPGPDGEAVRRKLEKQWAAEEAARKAAERKRMDAQFQSAQANATGLLGNRPAGKKGERLNFSIHEPLDDVPPLPAASPAARSEAAVLEADLKVRREAIERDRKALNADCWMVPSTDAAKVADCRRRRDDVLRRMSDFKADLARFGSMRSNGAPKVVDLNGPPAASLPAIDDETWIGMQKKMAKAREEYDARYRKTQSELMSYVPPLKGYRKVHEGVVLGFGTDDNNAVHMLEDGVSPFNGKSYRSMNDAAEKARAEGKEEGGGAVVVSFGTPKGDFGKTGERPPGYWFDEGRRVLGDHLNGAAASLSSPQARMALDRISGTEFDRLVAHSNGATVAEALIRNEAIRVNELNIVGGDMSLMRGKEYRELVESGKVKRVVVWINGNDPVPGLTSVAPSSPFTAAGETAEAWTRKIVGPATAGVEYRIMWGADSRKASSAADVFSRHYVESSYFPGIASFYGTEYSVPKRVVDGN